jgi:hypothetical protein
MSRVSVRTEEQAEKLKVFETAMAGLERERTEVGGRT